MKRPDFLDDAAIARVLTTSGLSASDPGYNWLRSLLAANFEQEARRAQFVAHVGRKLAALAARLEPAADAAEVARLAELLASFAPTKHQALGQYRVALAAARLRSAEARLDAGRRKGGKTRGAQARQRARLRAPDAIETHVLATAARLDPKRKNPRGLPRRIIEASGWHLTDSLRRMVARILANRTRS